MEMTMVTQPTEVDANVAPPAPVVPEISTDPMDFQKEINKIAAEMGVSIKPDSTVTTEPASSEAKVPVAEPVQPGIEEPTIPEGTEQPKTQAADKTETVPDKFKAPDGGVDQGKLLKSSVHVEEALRRYQEKEAELKRTINNVNALEKSAVQPQTQTQGQPQQVRGLHDITPQMIEEEIKLNGAGVALQKLSQLAYQQALNDARAQVSGEVEQIKSTVESRQRADELREIAKTDPWVFTEEGISTLAAIRQSKPHLNHARDPWKEAYRDYLAEKVLQQRSSSQVLTPTPKAPTAKAPATPVGAVNKTDQTKAQVNINDPKALNAYLDKLTPAQQAEFWKRSIPGLRV